MRTGRPIPLLILSDSERETLGSWARRPKSAQALAFRARMILMCGEGTNNTCVAHQLGVRVQTVCKWRQRFVDRRLDGLLDEPRAGHAAQAERCPGRARADHDAGIDAPGRLALVDAVVSCRIRAEPKHREPHLARLRPPAAPQRNPDRAQSRTLKSAATKATIRAACI
jgi:transposase-like protein